MNSDYEVIIVGGSQAGLALGHCLARQQRHFTILDAAPQIGDAWRTRWRSLTLFTPARYSALPGMGFPGDPEHLPTKDEVADYLAEYAAAFELPVRTGVTVSEVRAGASDFELETTAGALRAEQVVIATGPFQKPTIPRIAAGLASDVVQLHSSAYQGPEQLPAGDVLVVGGGNSGVQIAAEVAAHRTTWLSVGTKLPRFPERLLGRSIFWWLERAGLMDVTVSSRLGRRLSSKDSLIGQSPQMIARSHGVKLLGRTLNASGRRVRTEDGREIEVGAVIWATGFHIDLGFVRAAAFDAAGRPMHVRGESPVPGLHFLGLPWLHTRGSGLIGFVGRDAEFLAGRIAARAGVARVPAGS